MPDDVDSFDACYLPNGKIVFGSTASFQSVPCWHGLKKVSNLYLMQADGSGVRQVCFDQDHDLHPTVLPTGQVLYHRWDYTGINHIFLRELMLMNPDGTGQRALYGSGSWYPNALYFPQPLPGEPGKNLAILSGYHGPHRMGQLVVLDTTRGWHEAAGIVQRLSGRGDPVRPLIKDNLVEDDWPKFLHPFPLSAKYFLVAAWPHRKAHWGIYLADVFDNLVRVREEPGWALLEPVLLKPRPRPPVVPEQVDLRRDDGLVYLHDVHLGPGLQGVPRGTVRSLRVLAYHFGYLGLAGPDRVGYGGPWEVMRILGTVPLEADGSALFRVPANTPIAFQALDAEGKAVQLMRSWFTVMPGEKASCIGCHERPSDTPRPQLALAARREPRPLTPWHGPARGFDFEREVQPVLDRHCVKCHDGNSLPPSPADSRAALHAPPDLRSLALVTNYSGRRISQMGIDRMHPRMRAETRGILKYTPAYEALLPYLRRVGIEDDVSLLTPGEYHADTSPLIQMLRQGHYGVQLDAESWDRLVTWIDLNAPCHGTWGEVYPIPDGAHERRMALRRQFGGPKEDPEEIPRTTRPDSGHAALHAAASPDSTRPGAGEGRTFHAVAPADGREAREPAATQAALRSRDPEVAEIRVSDFPGGPREKVVPLADGLALKLVRIPAGELVRRAGGEAPSRLVIAAPFWMATCEISNEQFRRFDPAHDSRYYQKRYPPTEARGPAWMGPDARGLSLNGDRQPVVRVSWEQAMAFCRWLSARTGLRFDLPTEAQWEWACRAGTATPFSFGGRDADFSRWANLADLSFSRGLGRDGKQITGGLEHLVLEGAALSDTRCNDQAVVTAEVGSFQPNAWGLHDLHGNAAEWTRDEAPGGRKVVRGGSFFDPPARSTSTARIAYPGWQRVFNVGFRVVCEDGRMAETK
jgi:formylglycine-generating enzyme required for sulfatase activity